jgi:hypothetical protein
VKPASALDHLCRSPEAVVARQRTADHLPTNHGSCIDVIMIRGVLRSVIVVALMTGPALAETPSKKPVAGHKAKSHKAKAHKARAAHHHKSHAAKTK